MSPQSTTDLRVLDLRTEHIRELFGSEAHKPKFSWILQSSEHNVEQSQYRIQVALSEADLAAERAMVWDSGARQSADTFDIAFEGPTLRSRTRYWWRVQVVDHEGRSAVSEPTWFETGLLSPDDWTAQWINIESDDAEGDRKAGMQWIWGATALVAQLHAFRLDLNAPNDLVSADVLVAGKDRLVGAWVNGQFCDTGTEGLPHGCWGVVTPLPCQLSPGHNSICVAVRAQTEGFFPVDGGSMAALIRLRRANGEVERLVSGPEWKLSLDPAEENWMDKGFDAAHWPAAQPADSLAILGTPLPPERPLLARREFAISKPISRARLFASALGVYRAELNGQPVADAVLLPEISVNESHTYYQSFDVTDLLQNGVNALGFEVADGFYAGPFTWQQIRYGFGPPPRRLIAQLELEYADGTTETVSTGPDWKLSDSARIEASIYGGETYDATLEQHRWSCPDFDETHWTPAVQGTPPETELVSLVSPPVRPLAERAAVSISEPEPGIFVYDFGQNFSGWVHLKCAAEPGTTVTLRFAELQHENGLANQTNLRSADATARYTCKGDPNGESYEPQFTYFGFRYVQVEGFPGRPDKDSLVGIVAHSDCPITGEMKFEHPLLDKFWHNTMWSQKSNFFGVPTDCPQRDERMGWMGDIQVFADAAAFNMDVDGFLRRFLREARAAQKPDGSYPIVVPQPLSFPDTVTPGWSEAGIILPYFLWQRYGDTAVIEENWHAMERWMTYVSARNPDYIWREGRGIDLGDWLSVDAIDPADETTPRVVSATAYWAWCAQLMSEMARVTGRDADSETYAALLGAIQNAARLEFILADGTCGNGSQTSQVLCLYMRLVPDDLRAKAAQVLVDEIRGRGTHLSTGFLGTPYLLDVLADAGHWDVVSDLLETEEYPSWGYMVSKGATTMWERWNSDTTGQQMNSYNHYAFGAVVGFFYRRLGGIAPAAPGFRRLSIRPKFLPAIGSVSANYESRVGRIETKVEGDADGLSKLQVTVPANTIAEVELPSGFDWEVGGLRLEQSSDIKSLTLTEDAIRFETGSGSYNFTR